MLVNKKDTHALWLRSQMLPAWEEGWISNSERQLLEDRLPLKLYHPGFFVRMGLLLFTLLVVIFVFGILLVFFRGTSEKDFGYIGIAFAVLLLLLAEWFRNKKRHYQSGVDDALIFCSALSVFLSIVLVWEWNELPSAWLAFSITGFMLLRYGDLTMAIACIISLHGIVFFTLSTFTSLPGNLMLVFMLIFSCFLYYLTTRLKAKWLKGYRALVPLAGYTALAMAYLACNRLLQLEAVYPWLAAESHGAGMSWIANFLYLLMYLSPFAFAFLGYQKRDKWLFWLALLCLLMNVYSLHLLYPVLEMGWLLLIAGAWLCAVAWLLIRYLTFETKLFTVHPQAEGKESGDWMAFAAAQALPEATQASDFQGYGGGQFGGGGASGSY